MENFQVVTLQWELSYVRRMKKLAKIKAEAAEE